MIGLVHILIIESILSCFFASSSSMDCMKNLFFRTESLQPLPSVSKISHGEKTEVDEIAITAELLTSIFEAIRTFPIEKNDALLTCYLAEKIINEGLQGLSMESKIRIKQDVFRRDVLHKSLIQDAVTYSTHREVKAPMVGFMNLKVDELSALSSKMCEDILMSVAESKSLRFLTIYFRLGGFCDFKMLQNIFGYLTPQFLPTTLFIDSDLNCAFSFSRGQEDSTLHISNLERMVNPKVQKNLIKLLSLIPQSFFLRIKLLMDDFYKISDSFFQELCCCIIQPQTMHINFTHELFSNLTPTQRYFVSSR